MDLWLLIKATFGIYWSCCTEAVRQASSNWRMVIIHLGGLAAFGAISLIAGLFGSLVGGFIIGLFSALLISVYLGTVRAGVEKDRLSFREAIERGAELFSPAISVLFVLFLASLLTNASLQRPEQEWIKLAVGLVITVLFNPLPEIIYLRPGFTTEMFGVGLEFMKENFIEWFLPFLILCVPLLFAEPQLTVNFSLLLVITNPLYLMQLFMAVFGSFSVIIRYLPLLAVFLYCIYVVFIFRGLLFKELSSSTRRKRVYQARFGR